MSFAVETMLNSKKGFCKSISFPLFSKIFLPFLPNVIVFGRRAVGVSQSPLAHDQGSSIENYSVIQASDAIFLVAGFGMSKANAVDLHYQESMCEGWRHVASTHSTNFIFLFFF